MAAGNVLVGDRLGFYRALAGHPMLPRELAEHTGTATRYVDEWLRGQAAGGYVEYDPRTGAGWLTPEQAFALTDPDGAVFAPGALSSRSARCGQSRRSPRRSAPVRCVGWHEHHEGVFSGCGRFLRARVRRQSGRQLAPALYGVEAKLNVGAKVADVGCGHGASSRP